MNEQANLPPGYKLVDGEVSDGYHTHGELYAYRRVYNAMLFNEWVKQGLYSVHKSLRHSDGEPCFGGEYFIVVAQLPTGQISNHYKLEHWDKFQIPEQERSATYDGHTPKIALARMEAFLELTFLLEEDKKERAKAIVADAYRFAEEKRAQGWTQEDAALSLKNMLMSDTGDEEEQP